ncbi:MAG TPA: DUF2267 domain-containing protein [Arthrobacter sp.]|nr:DUF2267 domain-containing protein [Arthrobacter sp.]
MQSEEFLDQVQNRAGLTDREQAAKISQTVLAVFGQLPAGGEIRDAASQLPKDIEQMLGETPEPEKFAADEFIERIQSQLDVSREEADQAATAVLSTVSAAVTEGQRVELLNKLPNDFSRFATSK